MTNLENLLPALGPTAGCVIVALYLTRQFTQFLENHMSQHTRALVSVNQVLVRLCTLVERCKVAGHHTPPP
jgi:hypothetical protein